jgi:anaerobic selenocysteine-containing dehydrogenase
VVYHFHNRTKTGRSKELNEAAPEVYVQISKEDAASFEISEGEMVEVESRRGTVRGAAQIGDIIPGHVFVPFHYGYWDDEEEQHNRAANELTLTVWDTVSKQPHFKYAAVRISKAGEKQNVLSSAVEKIKEKINL